MSNAEDKGGNLPLSGIRVLDLGRLVAAPAATQLLGDLGAEIIKIERPGAGDDSRSYGPSFLPGRGGGEDVSGFYLSVNRNKKSVTVDFSKPEGAGIIRDLARHCDVLIENYKVGDLAKRGLDYPSLRQVNKGLIYCSVTGFGQTGPYATRPGVDSVFQAMSGLMSVTGEPNGPPTKVGLVIADLIAGLYAANAIQAALRRREIGDGTGQAIDLALLDVMIATMSHRATDYLITGEVPVPVGNASAGSTPAQHFTCADGELNVQAGSDRQFAKLCEVLGRPDIAADSRYQSRMDRTRHRAVLVPELAGIFATQPVAYWYERLLVANIISSPVYDLKQTFVDPHVRYREVTVSAERPEFEPVSLLRNPIRFSETPIESYEFPPLLGEHNDAVLGDMLAYPPERIADLRARKVI